VTPSFQKPTLNLSSLSGKKHLDVRALEALMKHWPDCQSSPEGRRFYRWIAPRAEKAKTKRVKRVFKVINGNPMAIRKPPNQQAKKRLLKIECEALCKKIVWARDTIDGVPTCVTCGGTGNLQWGHFISRKNCKALIYDPANTGLQTIRCNIFGQGEYAKFKEAINARSPGLADKLEQFAKDNQKFSWTVLALEAQKKKLETIIEKMGIK